MDLMALRKKLSPRTLLRSLRRWTRAPRGMGGKPGSSDRTYRIDFTRVDLAGDAYFVPAYGRNRPAARCILRGEYYEPLTHDLVGLLFAARPGE